MQVRAKTRILFSLNELGTAQNHELRQANVNDELARRLHHHATEEMGYLAEILPTLYWRVTLNNSL
jgi:hypothetical protein